jgi:hypothetical protein
VSKKHKKHGGGQKNLFKDIDTGAPDDDRDFSKGQTFKPDKSKTFAAPLRCYATHPPIVFPDVPGKLYGGSCSTPVVEDADVYVGLDGGMTYKHKSYPWAEEKEGPQEIFFKILDGNPPSDEKNFELMIGWLVGKLYEGKNVHVGCIGGHGRTGMVLAAIVKQITGEEDAITWTREHYCKKAVESKSQVDFMHRVFDIKAVNPSRHYETKPYSPSHTGGIKTSGPSTAGGYKDWNEWVGTKSVTSTGNDNFIPGTTIPRTRGPRDPAPPVKQTVRAMPSSSNSIWGTE